MLIPSDDDVAYRDNDNGDMLCELSGADLPDALDPKALKKQLKQRQANEKRKSKAMGSVSARAHAQSCMQV